MKSNVCKIDNGTKDLAAILEESERVAKFNGFTDKQTLQLRLLCEEVDGMLPNIIEDFEGNLWIEYENGVCKVNISIRIPEFNLDKKEDLIAIARNKKNAAASGIVGKIRSAIENFFLDEEPIGTFDASFGAFYEIGYTGFVDYSCLWSLEQYRSTIKKEEKGAAWDELEKSVIASVADDVIVGVKGRQADIIIVKKFA
jgi:hypothetical protein